MNAVVAQLVEHGLPKPRVAGSSPVYRSQKARPFHRSGIFLSTRPIKLTAIL